MYPYFQKLLKRRKWKIYTLSGRSSGISWGFPSFFNCFFFCLIYTHKQFCINQVWTQHFWMQWHQKTKNKILSITFMSINTSFQQTYHNRLIIDSKYLSGDRETDRDGKRSQSWVILWTCLTKVCPAVYSFSTMMLPATNLPTAASFRMENPDSVWG